MVLKELTFNGFFSLGGCGGLERTYFLTVSTLGRSGGLGRTYFHSLYIERVWWF